MTERPSQREYWSGKVGDEWAAQAQRIDAMLAPMTDAALERAAFAPGETVLDIGCGAGATSLEIARRVAPGGSVVGVDISPQMLQLARTRAGAASTAIEFLDADVGEANFTRRFDAAFSRFGVMFFEAPAAAFAHIRAQLHPGGRLTFVCWRVLVHNTWATTPVDALGPMLKAPMPAPDPEAPGPFAFADSERVRGILAAAGWRAVELAPWDGLITIGGGGDLTQSADFLLRIGPCARAIADQGLDLAEARQRLMGHLAPLHRENGVALGAACWIVSATA